MILDRLSVIGFRNIIQADLAFSRKLNCFLGANGMGKTNLLDAIYFLSFCKSCSNPVDSQNIRHGEDFFMLQGHYRMDSGCLEEVCCGLRRQKRKILKRNQKEYPRLSDHIGCFPLVMVSPEDSRLIQDGSEQRRRFMDQVISQYDRTYLDALIRYNRALDQRNAMLRERTRAFDTELFRIQETVMDENARKVIAGRRRFLEEFTPAFQEIHSLICEDREAVTLTYDPSVGEGSLTAVLEESREREMIVGYTLHGPHRDDLDMALGGYSIRREGSQGQTKTFLVALKLAQFEFLSHKGQEVPILLLDDIFDKLDARRVEQIIKLTGSERFGQIFITDTNRENLDRILRATGMLHRIFSVEEGRVTQASCTE